MQKISIKNNTDLSIELVAKVIDHYMDTGDPGETFYFGKVDSITFDVYERKFKCTVLYLKREIQYIIEEVLDETRDNK